MNRQALLFVLTAVLIAAARAGHAPGAGATAPSAEQAVRQAVEASGFVYAGECAATRSPEDIGKTCSTLVAERGDTRAYLTGRTFSEYSTWVFVRRTAAGWTAVATTRFDFFAPESLIPWPA